MRKLQKLLALFGFILVAGHLMAPPVFGSTRSDSGPATPAARKASSENIAGGLTRLPGHVLPALKGAASVPASPGTASKPLTLTVVLKHTDQGALDAYLQDIYDPKSPAFHRFLQQDEIADVFGPTREEYEEVLHYLSAKGFKLVEGSANRLTLTVTGTRAQAESAFALHIGDYRLGDREFYANDKDPAVPARFASSIQAVAGLSDLARPRANKDEIHNLWVAICKTFWKTFGVKTADIPPFFACGTYVYGKAGYNLVADPPGLGQDNGAGQTVGLIEFDTFLSSDVANFISMIGSPASLLNNVTEVKVNGGASPGPNQDEVLLDIDTVLTIAPGAKVVVYDAPFTGPGASFQTLFNAAINGGSTIISNSWAYCENQTTAADVLSIDTLFQTAAVAGISVFNGAGDTGSTCLDGSANTVSVPADSPNATAVGGSSLNNGPGYTYGTETWWNGVDSSPPTGQGGFGVSKFFPTPPYQIGLTTSTFRSVPDVVANADPAFGVQLCQASTGGCPNGLLYGGTSVAAPAWAAFTAVLNEALGHNLGAFNRSVYPFANTTAFHNAASMGSDFAHVGLGSPNLNQLYLKLGGIALGTPDANQSTIFPYIETPLSPSTGVVPADGTSQGFVNVALLDANGNPVPGKTVTLSANSGSHAQISPATAVTTVDNGTAVFTLTDLVPENITLAATDSTDGIALNNNVTVPFGVPPAASAGINAFPTTVTADGVSTTTITLTLEDSLGRPTPGKLITLSEGSGHSVISGPNPSVTDSNGQIQFTAVDQVPETVIYTATDVTDGNLPFPGSGTVSFINGVANGCGNGNPTAGQGFLVTPYATGFVAQNFFYGDVNNNGCPGAFGIAFDGSGNLYVGHAPTGDIYKFPPGGGVANSTTLLTPSTSLGSSLLGPGLGNLAFDKNGNLFVGRGATTGNFFTGAVFQVDPVTGAVLRVIAGQGPSGTVGLALTCPTELAIDPLSDDLFVDDNCSGAGSDNPSLWRVSNPSGPSPATTVYATMPGTPASTIAFAPSGTFYVWDVVNGAVQIEKVSGTNVPGTPTVTPVSLPINPGFLGLLAGGTQSNGDAAFLVYNYPLSDGTGAIGIADLTTNPPSISTVLVSDGVVNTNNLAIGPDGCIYAALGDGAFRITDATGACNYTAAQPAPGIALTPAVVSPSPAQGSSQSFTASLHHVTPPAGVQVVFQVTGANPQLKTVQLDANGQASFSYTAVNAGTDTVLASATVNTASLVSNPVQFTWTAGLHTTFLTLNPSPTAGTLGIPVTVIASLTDLSVKPAAPLAGESVALTLDGDICFGSTDVNGIASCVVTPTVAGIGTLTANFTQTSPYLAASTSKGFTVSGFATTLSYTGPTTLTNNNAATLSAVLTNAQGNSPISGEIITFTLGTGTGAQTCSGTTDGTGKASCSISSVNQPPGSGTLKTSFAGDGTYVASSVSTGVTVTGFVSVSVTVPNVVGDTLAAATTAIDGARLIVGTVTNGKPLLGGTTASPGSIVLSQTPAPGSHVAPGSAVNLVVLPGLGTATPGKPKISGKIIDTGRDPSGALFVDLELADTGKGDAVDVQISRLALRALRGRGKVTYDAALSGGPLPLEIGTIAEGTSTTVRLFFNVPSKVTRFSIDTSGTMLSTAGKRYDFTIRQPVSVSGTGTVPETDTP